MTTSFAPIPVDVRHAGGTVFVDLDAVDDLLAGCVTLDMPGLMSPTPLYPREARALAAALTAATTAGSALIREMAAERRTAREEVAR